MQDTFPFFISRTRHHPGKTPRLHDHDFVELVYVVNGTAKHFFEGSLYPIQAGDVFIINPGEKHTYRFEPEEEIEIINCIFQPNIISASLLADLEITNSIDYFYVHPFLKPNERFNHRVNVSGPQAAKLLALLDEVRQENEAKRTGYAAYIRLRLIELLLLLSRHYADLNSNRMEASDHQPDWLARRICGYVERNYEQKITHELLSEIFNVSIRQLNRLVKRETGDSLILYLQRIRVERAKQLLAKTGAKVATVANQVGYEDPSFFSRLFTKQTGYTPGQYRIQRGNEHDSLE